jgi:FMN phosphatase YigB (HAD superfamily)
MKALILDYEGVLIDGNKLMEQKSKQTAAVFKEPWTKEFHDYWKNIYLQLTEGRITLGEYYSSIAKMLDKTVTGAEDTEFMKGEKLRDKDLPTHLIDLRRKYGPVQFALIANYHSRWVEHMLIAHNMSKHFKAVVCSDKIKARMPHEEAYSAVLEKLQVSPKDCLYVSHDIHHLDAAKGMGMKVLYLGDLDNTSTNFTTIGSLLDIQKYLN